MHDPPPAAVNPYAPAGTAPAAAAHPSSFYCSHAVQWTWQADQGGFLPMVVTADEMHPGDIPIPGQGALPELCQPATGFDPREYPNAGPAAVQRATVEVLRERRERGQR